MKKIILIFLLPALICSQTKFNLQCRKQLLNESECIALSLNGTAEKGNNDGAVIRQIQKTVGIPPNSAYCAAGQYYCFYIACRNLNLDLSEIPIPRTGTANRMFNFASKSGIKTKYQAARHDLLVWKLQSTKRGHIERIILCRKAGWVETIAFNSSHQGREGIFIKKRNIYHPLGRLSIRGLIGFTGKEKK